MAINFPSTAGQPTDGSYTFTVSGTTYSWDGESWDALGTSESYSLGQLTDVDLSTAPTTGQVLKYNGTIWNAAADGGGGGGISNVVEDTTPQLGGNLDLNSKNIDGTGNINITGTLDVSSSSTFGSVTTSGSATFGTNSNHVQVIGISKILRMGGSTGLTIQEEGTSAQISQETGSLRFFYDSGNQYKWAIFNNAGSVDLYYANNKKFETTNVGVIITGSLTAGGLTYPTSNGTNGQVLTSDGSGGVTWTTVSGGGATLSRGTVSGATNSSHQNNSDQTLTLSLGKSYSLLKMVVSHQAWVRVYTSSAAATADSSRLITEDPLPGSGLIAEAITTTTNQTVNFTPALIGWNDESPVTANAYVVVRNRTGGTQAITVTLTKIELES
tara:strand:+ start:456 stop:1610 length:1155 start_codon:yes stop_codon:yes gene_type:complete